MLAGKIMPTSLVSHINIIQSSPTCFAHKPDFTGPNDFEFGTKIGSMVI